MSWEKPLFNRSRRLVHGESAVYHVVNRVALSSMILDDEAKAVFVKQMRRQAVFAGVEILAYCVMTNHFHVLVRVPEPVDLNNAELMRRYRALYSEHCPFSAPDPAVLEQLLAEGGADAEMWRRRLHARMHQLNPFVSELKQRFSIWFNKHRDNRGTLWSERFKSIIVEDSPEFTAPVAAYIDLNPVRAGIVEDPAVYPFSSFGALLFEPVRTQNALLALYRHSHGLAHLMDAYRLLLYGSGNVSAVDAESIVTSEQRLSWAEYLRMRIGYFTRGAILGSAAFIQAYGGAHNLTNSGNPLKGVDAAFYSLRKLNKRPLG